MWNKFLCKRTYIQNRNRPTDIEKNLMVTKRERGGGEINQQFGINIYRLLYIKLITDKDLLYSTGTDNYFVILNQLGVLSTMHDT